MFTCFFKVKLNTFSYQLKMKILFFVSKFIALLLAFCIIVQPGIGRSSLFERMFDTFGSPLALFVGGSFIVHEISFLACNLLLYIVYSLDHPFFEQFKIQSKPWPWRGTLREKEKWNLLLTQTIPVLLLNHLVILPLSSILTFPVARWFIRFGSVPSSIEIFLHIIAFMVCEDTLFYWGHRMLHSKQLYRIHKIHHKYSMPIGVASEFAHPVEFVVSNLLPFMVGPLLMRTHMFTLLLWTFIRVAETVEGHSGYEFPWSVFGLLPGSTSAAFHDHHHSKNSGNYASFFRFWDWIGGTNR